VSGIEPISKHSYRTPGLESAALSDNFRQFCGIFNATCHIDFRGGAKNLGAGAKLSGEMRTWLPPKSVHVLPICFLGCIRFTILSMMKNFCRS
jgi:hypothetical protein